MEFDVAAHVFELFFLRIRADLASIRTELGQYGQNCAILAGDRNKPKSALKHAETLRIH